VLSQQGVETIPIVVINGPDRDPGLVADLRRDSRLRLLDVADAGIPDALKAGREAIDTPWFSALDDDDLYLPGALLSRIRALESRPGYGAVVTNGLVRNHGTERLHVPDMAAVERDPLAALSRRNWLLPGAWLCRTECADSTLFGDMPRLLECTYLAIQLVLRCRVCFIDRPTVVWNADTPESESKSRDYVLGRVTALDRLLELQLPDETRRWLETSRTRVLHAVASLHLSENDVPQAWSWHVRSLFGPGGWRHMPFTLRLAVAAMRR
jgi:hypothetical protein